MTDYFYKKNINTGIWYPLNSTVSISIVEKEFKLSTLKFFDIY